MEVCDLFENLAFSPPKNLVEMYAWYTMYIKQSKLKPLDEIFQSIGLKYQRIKAFQTKLKKGYSDKEKIFVLDYMRSNETFIRAILDMFRVQI